MSYPLSAIEAPVATCTCIRVSKVRRHTVPFVKIDGTHNPLLRGKCVRPPSICAIVEGIKYVIKKVRGEKKGGAIPKAIMNLSFKHDGPIPEEEDAIDDAINEGIIVIVAAGNEDIDASLVYPAGYNSTITVAAINKAGQLTESNYGRSVDISAPGHDIETRGSTQECEHDVARCRELLSGTSAATPFVAGVVARHLQGLSDDEMASTNQETVREWLIKTATKGQITFREAEKETPNGILYLGCDVPNSSASVSQYAGSLVVLISVVLVFLAY